MGKTIISAHMFSIWIKPLKDVFHWLVISEGGDYVDNSKLKVYICIRCGT